MDAMRWCTHALLVGSLALASAPACGLLFEPKPEVDAPHHYAEHGLAFDYPGNWKLETEKSSTEGIETLMVTVESSGSGIAMVQQFRPAVHVGPDEMLELLTTELRKAAGEQLGGTVGYQQGRASEGVRTLLGAERPTRRTEFALSLLGEKVPHTFEVVMADLEDRTVVVLLQAANEDLETVRPAFDLLVGSLATR